jgi:hypothetical protein
MRRATSVLVCPATSEHGACYLMELESWWSLHPSSHPAFLNDAGAYNQEFGHRKAPLAAACQASLLHGAWLKRGRSAAHLPL